RMDSWLSLRPLCLASHKARSLPVYGALGNSIFDKSLFTGLELASLQTGPAPARILRDRSGKAGAARQGKFARPILYTLIY
ncbi:MAG: hypothetical protein ACTS5Y_09220, partial [Pollutimonas bauzanensis]